MPKKKTLSDYLGGAKAYATRPGQRSGQVGHRDARQPKAGTGLPFLEKTLRKRGGANRKYF